MGLETTNLADFVRVARTWAARHVGIGGLGTNPTNPWCQHPRRPPLQYKTELRAGRSIYRGSDTKEFAALKPVGQGATLLAGGVALFVGFSMLATVPLAGVLLVLGAMMFSLFPTARLFDTVVRGPRHRTRFGDRPQSSRDSHFNP